MATFQDAVNQLTILINEYITERNLLFTNKYSYDNDPWIKLTNKREMGFTLLSAKTAAQSCKAYYKQISSDSQFTSDQQTILAQRYAIFDKQSKQDGLSGDPIAPQLVRINPTIPFSGNVTKTIQQLHLVQDLLSGLLKMGGATQGKFLQMIIGYTRSGGLATAQDNIIIDVDMILAQVGLLAHITEHEIGHRDYAQWYGLSGPPNTTNLPFYRPSFITDNMSQPQRDETLADVYSAIVAAIFGIPIHDPFSRFLNAVAPPTPGNTDTHPPAGTRADIAQTVYSTLLPLFTADNTSIWYAFAQEIRDIAKIKFSDLPTYGDLDQIIADYPFSKQQQRAALRQRFPRLFTNTTQGYPPQILIDGETLLKFNNQVPVQIMQPFDPKKLMSVENFQLSQNQNPILFSNTNGIANTFANPANPANLNPTPVLASNNPSSGSLGALPKLKSTLKMGKAGTSKTDKGKTALPAAMGSSLKIPTSLAAPLVSEELFTSELAENMTRPAPILSSGMRASATPNIHLAVPPKKAPANMPQNVPFSQVQPTPVRPENIPFNQAAPSPVELVPHLPYYSEMTSETAAFTGGRGYYHAAPLEAVLLNGSTVQPLTQSLLSANLPQSIAPVATGAPIVTTFMLGRVAWEMLKNASDTLTARWTQPVKTTRAFTENNKMASAQSNGAAASTPEYTVRYRSA